MRANRDGTEKRRAGSDPVYVRESLLVVPLCCCSMHYFLGLLGLPVCYLSLYINGEPETTRDSFLILYKTSISVKHIYELVDLNNSCSARHATEFRE